MHSCGIEENFLTSDLDEEYVELACYFTVTELRRQRTVKRPTVVRRQACRQWHRGSAEDVQGGKNTMYDTIIIGTCHCIGWGKSRFRVVCMGNNTITHQFIGE